MASIIKRGNTYKVVVSNGRKPDGSQNRKYATFVPDPSKTEYQNKRALDQFAAAFEKKVLSGGNFDGEKITFEEFVPEWRRDHGERKLGPKTLESYDQLLKDHILPEIGYIKLKQIKVIHLNGMYDKLSKERKDGKPGGYPPATIKRIHAVVSSVLHYAKKSGIIDKNPCEDCTLPDSSGDVNQDTEKCFSETQAAIFLEYMREPYTVTIKRRNKREYTQIMQVPEWQQVYISMALLCGFRRSEMIALTWDDIDIEKREITISKATVIADHQLVTKKPKTEGSSRKISIPVTLTEQLRTYHKHQLEYKFSIGTKWQGKNYVFINETGGQKRPESAYKAFKRILHRYNESVTDPAEKLPDITLHGLRHTSATLLIGENTDIRTVSQRLGHSRTSTTLNIYSHALESKDKAAANKLEEILFKKKES